MGKNFLTFVDSVQGNAGATQKTIYTVPAGKRAKLTLIQVGGVKNGSVNIGGRYSAYIPGQGDNTTQFLNSISLYGDSDSDRNIAGAFGSHAPGEILIGNSWNGDLTFSVLTTNNITGAIFHKNSNGDQIAGATYIPSKFYLNEGETVEIVCSGDTYASFSIACEIIEEDN